MYVAQTLSLALSSSKTSIQHKTYSNEMPCLRNSKDEVCRYQHQMHVTENYENKNKLNIRKRTIGLPGTMIAAAINPTYWTTH